MASAEQSVAPLFRTRYNRAAIATAYFGSAACDRDRTQIRAQSSKIATAIAQRAVRTHA